MNLIKLPLIFPLLFLMACSAAYEKVKKIDSSTPNTFHQYLLSNYQQNASFEAEEMHDWNSAKLYSEKALKAMSGENIYPEKITYWKIPEDKLKEIRVGYDNLISILISLSLFYFLYGYLSIFFSMKKVVYKNWFYFILYLCTLEIIPYYYLISSIL